MNDDFIVDGYHFFVNLFLEEGPTDMDPVWILTVKIKDADGNLLDQETLEFLDDKEAYQFVEKLKRGRDVDSKIYL